MATHVTIRTVAREAGVSVSTVSAAFNPGARISVETRARVMEVAARLGWRPDRRASRLRSNANPVIGMIYEVNRPYQTALVDAVYTEAAVHGLDVVLAGATDHHSEDDCLALLMAERCVGIVFTGSSLGDMALREAAAALPVLALARYCDVPGVECVYCDPAHGEQLAVEHLVALGHRRIAHLGGSGRSMSQEREHGYREAMTRLGLEGETTVIHAGDDLDAGVRAAQMWRDVEPRPTAVTCYNDAVAAGLIMQVQQWGLRVPEDLSVVGYNDLPIAANPAINLSTVRQDCGQIAAIGLEMLAGRLNGVVGAEVPPRHTPLDSQLVVRRSSGTAQQ